MFWGFVVLLATLQIYANFGPPPSSPDAMAITAPTRVTTARD